MAADDVRATAHRRFERPRDLKQGRRQADLRYGRTVSSDKYLQIGDAIRTFFGMNRRRIIGAAVSLTAMAVKMDVETLTVMMVRVVVVQMRMYEGRAKRARLQRDTQP